MAAEVSQSWTVLPVGVVVYGILGGYLLDVPIISWHIVGSGVNGIHTDHPDNKNHPHE